MNQPPAAGFSKLVDQIGARINAKTDEAIRDVLHRMPWGHELTMADGSKATIRLLTGTDWPQEDADGRLYFTFDVSDKDCRWHVEFTVKHTGWGGAP